MSRKIEDLSPPMALKAKAWGLAMESEKINYIITCTRRTEKEQAALYAQGRTKPGPIVTWTMYSKHLTGDAFDFVIMVNGKPDWAMHHKELWAKAIDIGKMLGLRQVINHDGGIMEYAHLQRG